MEWWDRQGFVAQSLRSLFTTQAQWSLMTIMAWADRTGMPLAASAISEMRFTGGLLHVKQLT